VEIQIEINKRYAWKTKNLGRLQVHYCGVIENLNYICNKLSNASEAQYENFTRIVRDCQGNFAIIIMHQKWTVCAADKKRSLPIFYVEENGVVLVTDDPLYAKSKLKETRKDKDNILIFQASGYTFDKNTIFKGLFQIPAGCAVVVNETKLKVARYYSYIPEKIARKSKEEYYSEFCGIVDDVFKSIIKRAEGKTICIPLSGGLDSRLVLGALCALGYKNIKTYTYGVKNLWEKKFAQKIAKKAGVEWYDITYKRSQIREEFEKTKRKEYFAYAGGFCSTPQLPEYYGALTASKKLQLNKDTIFVNGQSGDFISGEHISDIEPTEVSLNELCLQIIQKHCSLWQNLLKEENICSISKKIVETLDVGEKGSFSKKECIHKKEHFELNQRQAIYVVNGQRAYEFLGYCWELPLWHDKIINFFKHLPIELKYKQSFYKYFLKKRDYCGLFSLQLPPKKVYYPWWAHPLRVLFLTISKVTGTHRSYYFNKYLRYFMNYGFYYTNKNYREYLIDSKYHRNAVSYWSRIYLDECS